MRMQFISKLNDGGDKTKAWTFLQSNEGITVQTLQDKLSQLDLQHDQAFGQNSTGAQVNFSKKKKQRGRCFDCGATDHYRGDKKCQATNNKNVRRRGRINYEEEMDSSISVEDLDDSIF